MADDEARSGAARADLCRFLAACYYEPDARFAEERLFESMAEAAGRVDPGLAEAARRLGEAFASDTLDDLLLDYTRLFLGPVDTLAKPYGSVWLGKEKTLMQDSTMDVLALYEEGGFEIAEDFRELPDHVAAELEFLYLLLFRENSARRDAQSQALSENADLKRRFLGGHLGRWAGPFCEAVRGGARSDFYRALADLTDRFIATEARRAVAG
ncbi:MAG: molecular chaperone TorD family protein [Betaproteobacteria bacterium]|nr:molecular chaperone TorD family protein [Betaproteobacteria bacterium]